MNRIATIGMALVLAAGVAGCDSFGGGEYSVSDAKSGAAFRHHARDVVAKFNLKCPFTEKPEVLAQYDEAQLRYDALKDSISGRSFATDLASAEADYEYLMSVTDLECAAPDGEGTAEKVAQEIAQINAQLEQLEKIVGGI